MRVCESDSLCTHFSLPLNCVVVPLACAHAEGGGVHISMGGRVLLYINARECLEWL